ncbi:MAG: oligoendopeptidase F, partial [Treponema sp.]|nr:oligoendopeptidase F [Treponema sp.]
MAKNSIPTRNEVPASDKWDLSTLYKSDEDWEKALSSIKILTEKVVAFKGKLGDSSDSLLGCLKAIENLEKVVETVHEYAGLQHTADESDAAAQDREGRAMMAYAASESETSFFSPELMAIPDEKINEWKNLPEFADYKIFLEKELHHKPYILSEKEERILSLQSESSETAYKAF